VAATTRPTSELFTDEWSDDVETPGDVTTRTLPGDYDDGIPSGIQGPFFQQIGKRKIQGRDAKVLVTADDGATGVGKSNLCDFLGYALDTSAGGFAPHKVTIEPARFIELYGELEIGSSLVMEEAEQFDSRRGMRNENVDASQKWQQARVRQIIALLNLPDPSMIDRRFEKLADYWINVEIRGRCRIYEKKIHRTKKKVYYKTLQVLEWPNMDGSETFRTMDDLKGDLLDGETEKDGLIRESEAEERVGRAVRKAKKETRDELLTSIYRETELTAGDVAGCSAVDIKASRVRQIANEQG
jgi:hypothetical protein